jgi:N-acyl homoserine lactone hydrolase
MKRSLFAVVSAFALSLVTQPADAQAGKPGIDKLYVLDCGHGHATDQSRWSPGVNVGVPFDVSDNCYLIHHAQGYLLWDTGIADAVAAMPEGQPGQNGAPTWLRPKTLAAQLEQIGVKPADVKFVAISHTHPDHIGNVELFSQAMLLVQKAEYEWPLPTGATRFKLEHPVTKLEGDHDVFGDGSVTILSTPGHTPGHQSLLVKLPKTGAVILSGDAVHFKDNWENRRVPAGNVDKDKTLASMQHIADLLTQNHAQLWINHDKSQSEQQKHAPDYYE